MARGNPLQIKRRGTSVYLNPPGIVGNVFYVDNTNGSNSNNGRDWQRAFSTLNYAISKCSDDSGDLILLAPYHAETVNDAGSASGTATDEVVIDKCGITIRGLGSGQLRPTFTIGSDDTTAAFVVTAGTTNVVLDNVILISGLADVAAGITLTATSDGFTLLNSTIRSGLGGSLEMVIGMTVAADCDDVKIHNCIFSTEAGGCASAITCAGGCDRMEIVGCYIQGTYSVSGIKASVAQSLDVLVAHNVVTNQGAASIDFKTDNTGVFAYNIVGGTTSIAAALVGTDAMYCCENYVTGAAGASGLIDPTVAS